MNSIALARGGFYDGALAGAIGSQVTHKSLTYIYASTMNVVHIFTYRDIHILQQVINITLGVGLPALLYCFTEFLNDFRVDDYIKVAQKEANRYVQYMFYFIRNFKPHISFLSAVNLLRSLFLLTCLLLVVILTYVSVIAPFLEMFRSLLQAVDRRCRACTERVVEAGSRSTYMPEHVTLTYVGAAIQILVFIAVYAVFISTNEMKSS